MSAVRASARAPVAVQHGLLDRHALPKLAMTFIAAASLAGTLLTMATHGAPWELGLVRWLHLASLGWLAGGAMWWGWFVRTEPDAEDPEAVAAFGAAMVRRYRPIMAGAAVLGLATSPHLLLFLQRSSHDGVARGLLAVNVLLLAWSLTIASWPLDHGAGGRPVPGRLRGRLLMAGAALTLVVTAMLDARLTFPQFGSALLLRPLHVVAFGLWMGGAAWNLLVAIPTARQEPTPSVVVAAAHQLERFRWAVRLLLPTLLVTGLLQALPYGGGTLLGLGGSPWGRVILMKMGLVVALVGIFITCPLWRACSPIRGMCDLRELQGSGAVRRPMRTLDNRGRACAGFVHIRRELEALREGELLTVLSTDPIAWWELPAWLELEGHTLVQRDRTGRWRLLWPSYRFVIRKGPARRPALGEGDGAPERRLARAVAPGGMGPP